MTYASRVAKATANEGWQLFRESLKGTSTKEKLEHLQHYWIANVLDGFKANNEEDVEVRLDNYLKALARGGQLERGVNLDMALKCNWKLPVRKNK